MTTTPRTALVILLASASLLCGPAASPAAAATLAAQPSTGPTRPGERRVDLRPKFQQGQQVRYVMHIDTATDVKSPQLPELDQKQTMKQELHLRMRVVETGSDGSVVELIYDRVKVSLESDAFSAEYDSANPPRQRDQRRKPGPNPKQPAPNQDPGDTPQIPGLSTDILDLNDDEFFAKAMGGIAGTVVTIHLDPAGNIKSVSGTASLVPGGVGGAGGAGGVGGVGGAMQAIGGAGGGSWLVSSPGQSGFASIGETWTTTSSLGGTPLGNFTMVTNYTLRSASGNTATIAISGGIDAGSTGAGPAGVGGAQIKDSRYSGSYSWDTGAGQLREMQTTQSATIEGSTLGTPVVMRSSTDVKVRRVR